MSVWIITPQMDHLHCLTPVLVEPAESSIEGFLNPNKLGSAEPLVLIAFT